MQPGLDFSSYDLFAFRETYAYTPHKCPCPPLLHKDDSPKESACYAAIRD